MIERLLKFAAIGLAVGSLSCSHSARRGEFVGITNFAIERAQMRYERRLPSVSGRFFILGGDLEQDPSRSTVHVLETNGSSRRMKVIESRFRKLKILSFQPIEKDVYGYVTCVMGPNRCSPGSVHFIRSNGVELEIAPAPIESPDLNFHDFLRLPNGNFVYLFEKVDLRGKKNENTIQEWNSKGQTVFTWSGSDDLKNFGPAGLPRINSIDLDSEGNFVISTPQTNSLYKIARPSGRVIAAVDSANWNFAKDPFKGFKFQHAARVLPNGHYLLFDNGDGVGGRPSRAVEYKMDFTSRTATLVWEFRLADDPFPFRRYGGMAQRLSNGNTVITWGTPESMSSLPTMKVFTEVDPAGRVVRELTGPTYSYRIWFEEMN
jgi:hypothetical protein